MMLHADTIMKRKKSLSLARISLCSMVLLLCLITISLGTEAPYVSYYTPGTNSIQVRQDNIPQLAESDTFSTKNNSQPGLICYVEGNFSWTPREDVRCKNAVGGITDLPDGWVFLREDIKIRRGLFGWKEGATYECTVKTLAGVPKTYTASIFLTKNGTPLSW